jgi:hypothetical protein
VQDRATQQYNSKIIQTRIDHALTSHQIIHTIECIAILDNYSIGSDHRPVFVSLQIDRTIPHVASISQITNTSTDKESTASQHEQPEIKYIKNKDDKALWDDYKNIVQEKFLQSSTLVSMSPLTTTAADIEEFQHVVSASIAETVRWQDTNQQKAGKAKLVEPETGDTNEPTVEVTPKTQPYNMLPEHKVHKQRIQKPRNYPSSWNIHSKKSETKLKTPNVDRQHNPS